MTKKGFCEICELGFKGPYNKVTCSIKCRDIFYFNNNYIIKKCENCKKEFKTLKNKICSSGCKNSLSRLRATGVKQSEESKRKKSIANKGLKNGLGYKHTPEEILKISVANLGNSKRKGKKSSLETRKKQSLASKGRKLSKEWKINIGLGNIGKKSQRKGTKLSKKTRQRMREATIKRVEKAIFNGEPICPAMGKNEKEILDQLEFEYNIELERQYRVIGYLIDGYDVENNTVYSVNENYHFDCEENYTQKHTERKNNILEHLKCKWVDILDKK